MMPPSKLITLTLRRTNVIIRRQLPGKTLMVRFFSHSAYLSPCLFFFLKSRPLIFLGDGIPDRVVEEANTTPDTEPTVDPAAKDQDDDDNDNGHYGAEVEAAPTPKKVQKIVKLDSDNEK